MHLSRTLTALLLVALPLGAGAQSPVVLQNQTLRLAFDRHDGHLVELTDRGTRQRFVTAGDSLGLWVIHLRTGQLASTRAKAFVAHRAGSRGVELVWTNIEGAPGLRVVASAQLQGSAPMSEWRLRLEGMSGLVIDSVAFPRVTGIPSLGAGEELAVPRWMGTRTREPRRLLAGPDAKGQRLEWFSPGALSFQAIALYRAGGPGLYAAAYDSLDYRKSFAMWGDARGNAGYEMVHLLENPGEGDRYEMSYPAVLGTFVGDWFTAAERYREWGTKQRWARESRLVTGRLPEWVTKTGLWVWNRGRSPMVLEPAAALQQQLGLPVSVFWHWWHKGAYDTSFPDYLPPREGETRFKEAVRTAHERGLHAIVYMNQRLWCLDTPSWTAEQGERAAVRKSDGTIRTEVYNIFNPLPCATMDVTTQQWRDKYAGIAQEVLQSYGLDGIYMDQAVLSLVCYAPDHGHPVGGGHYWLPGFRALGADIRGRNSGEPTTLAGEGGGENWLADLDLFLTLQVSTERSAEPTSGWEVIPFFQSVYHAYGVTYGSYSSLAYPPYDDLWPAESRPATALTPLDPKYRFQFYLEQARSFVWGMQPTIANFLPWQLTDRPREIDYALRLARLRDRFPEYLLRGTFLRAPRLDAPDLDVTISRVSIYAGRDSLRAPAAGRPRGRVTEYVKKAPSAIAGAWRSPEGKVAINLASITEDSLPLSVTIDPSLYGMRRGARVWRVDGEGGRQLVATIGARAAAVTLPLPPLGLAFLELEAR